ncbi:hypothetical protein C2S53_015681 [Perilla frutescens var. hirtella]|uniref:PWWP domain-containing protein n=1 Tax=Perilla frutescens var. hirtella TaxID=608512 RepID=A0AAD4P824_PERFH|nr:hypothetical protein C2S53_015681 [Perilla frutescens var. hirtella]
MGGSGSKPSENRARVSNGGSDSDAVSERLVESGVVVECAVDVNGSKDELVEMQPEKNEVGGNSLLENGECRPTGNEQLNGREIDDLNVDGDGDGNGNGGGTDEKVKDQDVLFRVGDFVWGKIKSHPWWPGQVYDPNDASEFAMKHKQEGRLLVAFFGDGSCSWCSPSQLIPFVDNFEEMSTDSSSKSFLNAVQRSTDEIGRLMELEMTCNCISKEKKDSLAKPEVTNAGLRAGVVVPELDVRRLSFPKYEPEDVFQKVMQLAKVVSVGNALDLAVLKSWLSAFYYLKGGHQLPVFHGPFHIEGLEDKNNKDANGVADDFSVPIEVPILGPQDDDWLSSPTVGSGNSQAPSENKVLHKRKQRSVAEIMGENGSIKPESRKLASAKEGGTDVEKSTTTRKRKKDNDGELKGGDSEQPSSTGKKGRKRKAEVLESPTITNAKDDDADGAKRGKLSKKPKEIDVAPAEDTSEAIEGSEIVTTPRERKKSKYLSPPYTNLAWRLGNSSFKSESQVENDKATKTAQAGESKEEQGIATDQPISESVDNGSQEKPPIGQLETLDTSVDTGPRTVKGDKKLSFPVSDVDVPVNELLSDIQHAALDPFYLSKKGSLDVVWAFVSALRSSTYVQGADYKVYRRCKTRGNQRSKLIEETAKSPDQNTSKTLKTQRKSDTRKSKNAAETSVTKTTAETVEGKTLPLPCLILAFTPGFPLPSKKEIVGLFGKFGSLNKKETKVETDSHSIRIVYTNDSDAEAAFKSSLSQSTFGSENVNYRLQRSPAGSKSRRPHPKVLSSPKIDPEKHETDDLVSDLNTMRQKLEITTAIVENYHTKFSSEDKSSLKDEMKHLMEKIETVGDKVRVVAEKSSS